MSVVKEHWKKILCVTLVVIVITAAYLGWRYYQNTHIYISYDGSGHVVGYEESEAGLIVVLEVSRIPNWSSDSSDRQIKFLVDNESIMLSPNMVYAMKNKLVGFDVLVTSRDFCLPDTLEDDNFICPVFGFVLKLEEWAEMTEAGLIDETEYQEFEKNFSIYTSMETLDWLEIG